MKSDNDSVHFLVDTEFKWTGQKLGPSLGNVSREVSKKISEINNDLAIMINELPNLNFREREEDPLSNFLISEMKDILLEIKTIEAKIKNVIDTHFDEFSINYFFVFLQQEENHEDIMQSISFDELQDLIQDYQRLEILYVQSATLSKYIKINKEEDKERSKIFQLESEETLICNTNIKVLYDSHIIKGTEFRAIILNHHFMFYPYIHIVYTVLRYDIIRKGYYFELFVTNKQHIKSSSIRQKEFSPKMFDENDDGSGFFENYARKIYGFVKNDAYDINLLCENIQKLNDYVFTESREIVSFDRERIKIKMHKNMVQYLLGHEPVDDNQTKVKLCDLRTLPYFTADDSYRFVIENTKRIIRERKILDEKSYTVIATSIELLSRGIIYEKQGEEDKHAEALLVGNYYNDQNMMERFKNSDIIYVIRLYQNGNIGCGLPCNRCVRVLHGNGINRVVYSMDLNNYRIIDMDETIYTYTTTGNKLLNPELYLYSDYHVHRRPRV
jgi:hypothetical protein